MKYTTYLSILIIIPSPLFAYLDPGTGSIILQTILGILAASLFVVKTYWYRLKRMVKNLVSWPNKNKEPSEK